MGELTFPRNSLHPRTIIFVIIAVILPLIAEEYGFLQPLLWTGYFTMVLILELLIEKHGD